MNVLKPKRTAIYKPALAWFCKGTLILTTFLLFAGGFTTSIDAGMAFQDWPLSDGSINPEGWMQDPAKRAEHGHRLLGASLGLLSLTLLCWTQLREARVWVRRLSVWFVLVVIFQGLMGGARVLFDIQNQPEMANNWVAQAFAIFHAGMALVTLCILCGLTLGTSRLWIKHHASSVQSIKRTIFWLGISLCGFTFIQSLLGAVIRHKNVGLAIPFFPHATAEGHWVPASWNWGIMLNFGHRLGAVIITFVLIFFLIAIWHNKEGYRLWRKVICLPFILLVLQIFLGAGVILSKTHPHFATAHHLLGTLFLGVCWLFTFWSFRIEASS